jgi:hypothetical protein
MRYEILTENLKVVEKESATLGWPSETVIPIDANHRSMCWFTHEDEPRFQPVWTSLECLVSKAASECTIIRPHSHGPIN